MPLPEPFTDVAAALAHIDAIKHQCGGSIPPGLGQGQDAPHKAPGREQKQAWDHSLTVNREAWSRMLNALTAHPANLENAAVRHKVNELLTNLELTAPVRPPQGIKIIRNTGALTKFEAYRRLYRAGVHYYIGDPTLGTMANGDFAFVVPASAPHEVRLGRRATGGHTAISRGAHVYFAGEISFREGLLQYWDNDSGHYRPKAKYARQVPADLLPLDKFRERRQ